MKSLNRKIKALLVLFSFAAYMPVSTMPSFADVNTNLDLNSSINGGYVGWNKDDANKYDVNVKGGLGTVAQFDWNHFNVGSKTTVDWIFSAGNQTAINRVLNSGGMSYIYGKLTSSCSATGCDHQKSGNVILINPNGIMFGNGSQVNLNSFTASTRDLTGMKNIEDAVKEGYLGDTLKVESEGSKNYVFTKLVNLPSQGIGSADYLDKNNNTVKTDVLTQNYKYGNVLTYDVANNTIAGDGNGTINGYTIGSITVDGSDFNGGYTADGQPTTQATNISLIANDIYVNESNLQTYVPNKDADGNFSTAGNSGLGISRSGVKLITADGVNFTYGPIGEVKATGVTKAVAADKEAVQGIEINNSQIWTGDAKITNKSNTYLIVRDSKVIGDKVADNISGQVIIESDGTVNILESRVETLDAGVDETSNISGLRYGDIDITGGYDVVIRNSKVASADSGINLIRHDKNAPAADKKLTEGYYDKDGNYIKHNVGDVGNINITAGNKVNIISNDISANKQLVNKPGKYNIDVTAGGNLKITAGDDVVITSANGSKTNAKFGTEIRGKNIEVTGAQVMGADVKIVAADVDKKNVQRYDANGNQVGSIVIRDAVVDAHGYDNQGTRSLEILGLDTTIIDTLVEFDTLAFHNNLLDNNNNLNNVVLTNGTTIKDRDSKDLVLESNGMLIIDKNNLLSKGYGDTAAVNQKGDITLRSTQDLVSIRNNSNINATGDILIDAATSAAIANSTLTTTGDITINANTAVAIGDSITDVAGTHTAANVQKTGSTLNAKNIDITAQGVTETPNGIKGVRVKNSKLNATNENTTIAANGLIEVMDNGEIKAVKDNKLTANNGKITVDATSKVKSTTENVIITQSKTADLDTDIQGKVTAAKNIELNVTGTGKDINASHLNNFEYGQRLALDAENNINLEGNSWNLNKVDFNAKKNNVTAKTGNVIIDDITLGNKTNRTTIQAKQNVKTQNGLINANNKKLIVNAEENIDIEYINVKNTNAGLEINVDANTAGTHSKNQQLNNQSIATRNVKLTAKDGATAIAKVKANTLETNGQLVAATDGKIDYNKDNIYSGNKNTQNISDAYIEVRLENGWTRNDEVDYSNSLPVPKIYQDHYDVFENITTEGNVQKDESIANRHKINDGAGDILLVYTRMSGCGETIIPDEPPTPIIPDVTPQFNVDNGLTETTVVRLPRHEEGVSAIAPVLNEITDPTANVIMAAASLTLDDENEANEDEF